MDGVAVGRLLRDVDVSVDRLRLCVVYLGVVGLSPVDQDDPSGQGGQEKRE